MRASIPLFILVLAGSGLKLATGAESDPTNCLTRYRRFTPSVTHGERAALTAIPIPGTSAHLVPLSESTLASLADAWTRENSFYAMIQHQGAVLGVSPKSNFPKHAPVIYFSEADARTLAAARAPRRALNESKDFFTAEEVGDPESGKFYRMLIRDQLRQRRADPGWQAVSQRPVDLFDLPSSDPVMKSFLDSLLGKHVSGINVMSNESAGEKFSIFSGQVRRIFSMKPEEGYLGARTELVYAEIQTADGALSTVLLTPHEGMASHDLYVHSYKLPALVRERMGVVRTARQEAAQVEQAAFRASPLMQGREFVGPGRSAPTDPEALNRLFAAGTETLRRFENPRTMVSGMKRVGDSRISFYMPRKRDYLKLQKGDLLWDLYTARYFIVGVDQIPPALVHNYQSSLRRSRLMIVRLDERTSAPTPGQSPINALPAPSVPGSGGP